MTNPTVLKIAPSGRGDYAAQGHYPSAEEQYELGRMEKRRKNAAHCFPVSKGHSFRVRSSYNWRIVTFECLGNQFRLLVFYRNDKQEYEAWLGMVDGSDTKVLARLEFHATHPGWHLHTNCETNDTPSGRIGGNVHRSRLTSRRSDFGVIDDAKALLIATEAFGVTPKHFQLTNTHEH